MIPEKERLLKQIYRRTRLIRILFIILIGTILLGYNTIINAPPTENGACATCVPDTKPKFDIGDANSIAAATTDLGIEFDAVLGEQLFKANCTACHTLGKPQTGPNLYGVLERWEDRRGLLYTWIKNPPIAMETGDSYVEGMVERWINKAGVMPPQAVSDEQIDDMLGYIRMHEIQMNVPIE